MDDLGAPIAYLVLRDGTPVYDGDGAEVGVVDHVLADDQSNIFHGLIIHTKPLPGRHLYADADQIAELRERGVVLSVPARSLHEPREPEPVAGAGGSRSAEGALEAGLRRAWDWIAQRRH